MDLSFFIQNHLASSAETKIQLGKRHLGEIQQTALAVSGCLLRGGKILLCGNGGSAADAEHIAAEFVGRFRRERKSLPAISLTGPASLVTAIGNDYGYENVFSRQVEGQGRRGDLLICLSTSGNSPSVLNAAKAARTLGILTVGLTGDSGGKLAGEVDIAIRVPSSATAHIQESHITIAHIVCEIADEILETAAANPQPTRFSDKIRTLAELAEMRPMWRRQGQTVVWTNGCFDLLHNGHIRNLADAKAEGNILIVGVNSDRSVSEIKGPNRPIQSETSRSEMLAALASVDYVTIFDDPTPVPALEAIQPDVHCKGADYADNKKPIPERETVEKNGGRIYFLELLPGFSTTGLIDRIRAEEADKKPV